MTKAGLTDAGGAPIVLEKAEDDFLLNWAPKGWVRTSAPTTLPAPNPDPYPRYATDEDLTVIQAQLAAGGLDPAALSATLAPIASTADGAKALAQTAVDRLDALPPSVTPDALARGGDAAFSGQSIDATADVLMDVDGRDTFAAVASIDFAEGSGLTLQRSYDRTTKRLTLTLVAGEVTVTAPTAPRNLAAVAGNGQALLTADAPTSLGGAVITYSVTANGSTTPGIAPDPSTGGLSYALTGLSNGVPYSFTAVAVNSAGPGPASNSASATPAAAATAPTAPRNLRGTAGSGSLTILADKPLSNGGSVVTSYSLTYVVSGVPTTVEPITPSASGDLSGTITGLTNGTPVTGITVRAVNAVGPSPSAGPISLTPAAAVTVPGAPTNLVGTPGSGQIAVTADPPASNGGASVDRYNLIYTPAGGAAVTTPNILPDPVTGGISFTITGLTPGTTYSIAGRTHNSAGDSAPSAAISVSLGVLTTPTRPRNVTATVVSDTEIDVAADAPIGLGGGSLASYTVYATPPGGAPLVTAGIAPNDVGGMATRISGLTPSTTYAIHATATTTGGSGTGEGAASLDISRTTQAAPPPVAADSWLVGNIPNGMGATTCVAVDEVNHRRYLGSDVGGIYVLPDANDGKVGAWHKDAPTLTPDSHICALGVSPDGTWVLALQGVGGGGGIAWRSTTGVKSWAIVTRAYNGDVHDKISEYRPVGHRRICFIDSNRVLVSCFRDADKRGGLVLITRSGSVGAGYTFAIAEVDLPIGGSGAGSFGSALANDRRVSAIVRSAKDPTCFYVSADIHGRDPVPAQPAPGGSGVWIVRVPGAGAPTATKIDELGGGNPGGLTGCRTLCLPKGDSGAPVAVGGQDTVYLGVSLLNDTAAHAGVWELLVNDPTAPSAATLTWRRINNGITAADDVSALVARRDTTAAKTRLLAGFRNATSNYPQTAGHLFPTGGPYAKTLYRCMDARAGTPAWEPCTNWPNFPLTADGKGYKVLGTADEISPQFTAGASVANAAQGNGAANCFDLTLECGGTPPASDLAWVSNVATYFRGANPWAANVDDVVIETLIKGYGAIMTQALACSEDGKIVLAGDHDRDCWASDNFGRGAAYAVQALTADADALFVRPNHECVAVTSDLKIWTCTNIDGGTPGTWTPAAMTGVTGATGIEGGQGLSRFAETAGGTVTTLAMAGGKIWRKRGAGAWGAIGTCTGRVRFACREGSREVYWQDGTGLWVVRDISVASPTPVKIVAKTVQGAKQGYGGFALDKNDPTKGYAAWGPGQGLTRYSGLNTATPAATKLIGPKLTATSDVQDVAVAGDGRVACLLAASDAQGVRWLESSNGGTSWTDQTTPNLVEAAGTALSIAFGGTGRYVQTWANGIWVGQAA